jgi:hypothetical protein
MAKLQGVNLCSLDITTNAQMGYHNLPQRLLPPNLPASWLWEMHADTRQWQGDGLRLEPDRLMRHTYQKSNLNNTETCGVKRKTSM